MLNKTILTPNDDLQRALDAAVPGSRFYLEAGVYRQKVLLCTPGLQIEGTGINQTTIIWDDYANKLHEDGQEYNTFRTYTMAIWQIMCLCEICPSLMMLVIQRDDEFFGKRRHEDDPERKKLECKW